jgi:hypothetical protein
MSYATSYMRKSWQIGGIIGKDPSETRSFPPEPLHPEGPLTREETLEEEAEVTARRDAIATILADILVKELRREQEEGKV